MSKKNNTKNVVILGAGISGLTVSYFLNKFKIKNLVLEKQSKPGGLLKSFKIKDFTFDNFIHISHAKKNTVKKFFISSAKNFLINPKPNNLYKNIWIDHSPQFNLFPLNLGEKLKIIFSYLLRNRNEEYKKINYENWLKGTYGDYFAKNFPMVYTEKYWATKSFNMSTSWIKFRMQPINLKDLFSENEFLDVTSVSKGKGFQGVVKRHNFAGVGQNTHGQHNRNRAPGSIGAGSTPSRVFKGMRMAGRTGGEKVTVQNLKILKIDQKDNLIYVGGSVPGSKNTYVVLSN